MIPGSMTIFSEIDLAAYDLDWFGMDAAGEIAHFTSGGTKLLPTR